MTNKEIVQQGLQARKDVRAAEARAERYRETADVIRDNLFREQMSHKKARAAWLDEKAIMTGWINRQHDVIAELREELAAAEEREKEGRQLRALISAAKSVLVFVILLGIRDIGWIVPWLVDSLTAVSLTCLGLALFKWSRNH